MSKKSGLGKFVAGAAIGAAGFLGFGALPGAVAGGIAGAGTALITSLLEEDTTACQFYYRQLYIGDGKVNGSDFNIKPNEINKAIPVERGTVIKTIINVFLTASTK